MTDLVGAASAVGARPGTCGSGLPAALVPSWPGSQARRWFVMADGQRLRQLRREHRLSQAALASRAGVSVGTVGQLERQACGTCRSRTLARLAAALGAQSTALMARRARPVDPPSAQPGGRPIATHDHPEPGGAVRPGTVPSGKLL